MRKIQINLKWLNSYDKKHFLYNATSEQERQQLFKKAFEYMSDDQKATLLNNAIMSMSWSQFAVIVAPYWPYIAGAVVLTAVVSVTVSLGITYCCCKKTQCCRSCFLGNGGEQTLFTSGDNKGDYHQTSQTVTNKFYNSKYQ